LEERQRAISGRYRYIQREEIARKEWLMITAEGHARQKNSGYTVVVLAGNNWKEMIVMKVRYICRFASLIAATLIPAMAMLFLGNKMQENESVEDYMRRREAEKAKV
jgi:hypothetical protein